MARSFLGPEVITDNVSTQVFTLRLTLNAL